MLLLLLLSLAADMTYRCLKTVHYFYRLFFYFLYMNLPVTLAALTYRVLTLNWPLYLTHLLDPYTLGRSLLSRDKHSLSEPAVYTVIGTWDFSYAAPLIWNIRSYLSKFAIARRLPLNSRGTLWHIIFPVPSLRPVSPSFPVVTAHASDLALQLTMYMLQIILLYCIVLLLRLLVGWSNSMQPVKTCEPGLPSKHLLK